MGTAEGIARELADNGRLQGFDSNVSTLNEFKGSLPEEGLILIVSASYNGKPPENAETFTNWLSQTDDSLTGVRYAVFGCGDTNWARTYQKVPAFIDKQLEQKGADRLCGRGEGDASGDFEMDFEEWQQQMWAEVLKTFDIELKEDLMNQKSSLSLDFVSGIVEKEVARNYLAKETKIVKNQELQSEESGRFTRHIELAVPSGLSYQEGDHLAIIPKNHDPLINRVLQRFDLRGTEKVVIQTSGRGAAHLPVGRPVSIYDLLSYSIELQQPASREQLEELAANTVCPPHKKELEALSEEDRYQKEVIAKRISMLDLMEKYEACKLPFERFLALLPPLKPRYYSISSSPKANPEIVSITVSVIRGEAWSGQGEYQGLATNYLMGLEEGNDVVMFFRTQRSFHLPDDPETPVIMVGPGTGIAPFRGFLQARDSMKREGITLGEAHLYFGSRHPRHDFLYQKELLQYEKSGIVKLHTAFSRIKNQPKAYVQDVMKEHEEEIVRLLAEKNGSLYICGEGSSMAPEVEETIKASYASIKHRTEEEAQDWLDAIQEEGRYVKDVW